MTHPAFPRRVLAVEAGTRVATLLRAGGGVEVHEAQGVALAFEALLSGEFDGAVVAPSLNAPGDGVSLVARALARGCVIPLVLAAESPDPELEERALRAGAAAIVDLATAGPRELLRALAFAQQQRARAETAQARFLQEIASCLTHEGKNALAAVGGTIQVIADRLPAGSDERAICAEVQVRLLEFSETLETITLLIQAKDLARE